jgi:hypothetical protein
VSGARSPSYPIEDFLQALTAQLDMAQDALALKVRGVGRPLTWALKDLNIDLRVFLEVDPQGRILLRSAGPSEEGASTVHLNLTTITRPMVEENTYALQEEPESDTREVSTLKQSGSLDDSSSKRLEWMGVRTVGQLNKLVESNPQAVASVIRTPIDRLRAALLASSQPTLSGHRVVPQPAGGPLIELNGQHLANGSPPMVHMAGLRAEVLEATPTRVIVRPPPGASEGEIRVAVGGQTLSSYFRLPAEGGAT